MCDVFVDWNYPVDFFILTLKEKIKVDFLLETNFL